MKLAVLGIATVALVACADPTVANDGQGLAQQSAETQAMFRNQWGDQATQHWAAEHNAWLTTHPPTPTPQPVGRTTYVYRTSVLGTTNGVFCLLKGSQVRVTQRGSGTTVQVTVISAPFSDLSPPGCAGLGKAYS